MKAGRDAASHGKQMEWHQSRSERDPASPAVALFRLVTESDLHNTLPFSCSL